MTVESDLREAFDDFAAGVGGSGADFADVQARAGRLSARRRVVGAAAVVAVAAGVLAVGVVARARGPETVAAGQPRNGVAPPVTGALRRAFEHIAGTTHPGYLIASGRTKQGSWSLVAHASDDGKPCTAEVGPGWYSGNGVGCLTAEPPADAWVTSDLEIDPDRLAILITGPDVSTVVGYGDVGERATAAAVRAGELPWRFAALRYPSQWAPRNFPSRIDTIDTSGVVHREDPGWPAGVCASSAPPREGAADALPEAGATSADHVNSVAAASAAAIQSRYSATAVVVAQRNGQVWRRAKSGGVEVVEAGDSLLTAYVPDARLCPATPQVFEGVPLLFVVGDAPQVPIAGPARKVPNLRH